MRFFNTAGPMRPEDNYCIPPLSRMDQRELLTLIRQKRYFVLHAPRQTGKTSALLALRDLLNGGAEGAWRCVYANVEAGQASADGRACAPSRNWRAGRVPPWARCALAGVLDTFGPDGRWRVRRARWCC